MRSIFSNLARMSLALLVVVACAGCNEVALCFSKSNARNLELAGIDEFNSSEIVNFSVSSISLGGIVIDKSRNLSAIQDEIFLKINSANKSIRDKALDLIGNKPGPRSVDQICAIFDSMAKEENWIYVSDGKYLDDFQFSNYTLEKGQKDEALGKGDCDDFAVLLAAFIESIGATSRIIFAFEEDRGHAYSEVYLGNDSGPCGNVTRMIRWLLYRYGVDEIHCHQDENSGETWLNLDWWKDGNSSNADAESTKHPGGPFYYASKHYAVYPDSRVAKQPLTPVLMKPIAVVNIATQNPTLNENISFDANQSYDIDGNISSYQWFFNDGSIEGKAVNHSISLSGPIQVNLTVVDDQGLEGLCSTSIELNEPPIPEFSFKPSSPSANELVTFDARESYDPDGEIFEYRWKYGNGDTGLGEKKVSTFSEYGTYNVSLTIMDEKGSQRTKTHPLIVSGANITNLKKGDSVSQQFDLIGDYYPKDNNKKIWIFVKDETERYYPQTPYPCNPKNASAMNGRWENRISIGGSNEAHKFFEIIAAEADEKADELIRSQIQKWWCTEHNGSDSIQDEPAGFAFLPVGVIQTHSVPVKRSDQIWNCSQKISDVHLPGKVSIIELEGWHGKTYPDHINNTVEESMTVFGSRSSDTKGKIWVLVHSTNGRWYPQSIDNDREHVTNIITLEDSWPEWHIPVVFSGKQRDIYDLVIVIANHSADEFFNDFQKRCAQAKNPDGTFGNYTGLLTIELPQGIDEKFRMRVQRNENVDRHLRLVSAGYDNIIRIWDVGTELMLCKMNHDGIVRSVDFSPDGRSVASASSDKSARIWDAETGKELLRLNHESDVISVKFSNDGQRIDTSCLDGRNFTWNSKTGEMIDESWKDIRFKVVDDGSNLAISDTSNSDIIWKVQNGPPINMKLKNGSVWNMAFSPDSRMLATAGSDGTVHILDTTNGYELLCLRHAKPVWYVAFSPDSREIITASFDATARIWDVETGQLLQELNHSNWVRAVALSPDGELIATGSRDNTTRIWDAETGEELCGLPHDDWVTSVDFGPAI